MRGRSPYGPYGRLPPEALYGAHSAGGGHSNVLVVIGVVVIFSSAFGMLCYQRHLKRKKEEYESLVKTLAPALVALSLVGYLAYNAPSRFFETKEPPEHLGVGLHSGAISGIPLKVFVILAVLTVGLHFTLRSSVMANLKHKTGGGGGRVGERKKGSGEDRRHRRKDKNEEEELLHPVWIRGEQNMNFPFQPTA